MSLHTELKQATQDQHHATEHLLFPQQNWSDFSLDDYREFLQVQYVFHQLTERQIDFALSSQLKQILDWPNRRKLGWLERDLQEISSDTPAGFTYDIAVASDAEAIGLLYVTEGSMLGGRMIEKALRKNEQLAPYCSFRFLAGYGSDTARYWKKFLGELENGEYESQGVIATAQRGFNAFTESVHFIRGKLVS